MSLEDELEQLAKREAKRRRILGYERPDQCRACYLERRVRNFREVEHDSCDEAEQAMMRQAYDQALDLLRDASHACRSGGHGGR